MSELNKGAVAAESGSRRYSNDLGLEMQAQARDVYRQPETYVEPGLPIPTKTFWRRKPVILRDGHITAAGVVWPIAAPSATASHPFVSCPAQPRA